MEYFSRLEHSYEHELSNILIEVIERPTYSTWWSISAYDTLMQQCECWLWSVKELETPDRYWH